MILDLTIKMGPGSNSRLDRTGVDVEVDHYYLWKINVESHQLIGKQELGLLAATSIIASAIGAFIRWNFAAVIGKRQLELTRIVAWVHCLSYLGVAVNLQWEFVIPANRLIAN